MGALVYWIPALLTAGFIALASHQPQLPEISAVSPDWLLHGCVYGLLALSCVFGATRGFVPAARTPLRAVVAVVLASVYGITDEWHQSFVGRDPALHDWVADTVGAALAGLLVLLVWRRGARSGHR